MFRRTRPHVLHLLVAAHVALFVFFCVQVPRVTRVRLVFTPQVLPNLSAGSLSARTEPHRKLDLAGSGGVIEPRAWRNLFAGGSEQLAAPFSSPDGLRLQFRQPLVSLGVQRIAELEMEFQASTPISRWWPGRTSRARPSRRSVRVVLETVCRCPVS